MVEFSYGFIVGFILASLLSKMLYLHLKHLVPFLVYLIKGSKVKTTYIKRDENGKII